MKTFTVDAEGGFAVMDVPKPKYNSKQALVKMLCCGICGTDQALVKGKFKGIPKDIYPVMLGHEGVGKVVEIGSEVSSFHIGDVVLLPFADAEESFGKVGSAWGAFSEYGVVNDLAAYEPGTEPEAAWGQNIVPEDIEPAEAAMIITFREVYSNIKYFNIKPEQPIVVYGCGPVGLTFIKFLKLAGLGPVITVARNEKKQVNAIKSGADIALNSSQVNVVKTVRKMFPDGVPYVLDCVGSEGVINEAMALICDRGEILCYGVPKSEQIHIDFSKAYYNWKLNFQQFPKKQEEYAVYNEILEWIRTGKLEPEEFISNYYKFDDIIQAFQDYGNKKIEKKGIIIFE